jgi:hypothetical protein
MSIDDKTNFDSFKEWLILVLIKTFLSLKSGIYE